jgi:hypothetical protein
MRATIARIRQQLGGFENVRRSVESGIALASRVRSGAFFMAERKMGIAQYRNLGDIRNESWRVVALDQLARTLEFSTKEDGFSPLKPAAPAYERAQAIIASVGYEYLPVPYVTATADGSITIEWRRPPSIFLTVTVPADGGYAEYYGERSGGKFEGEMTEETLGSLNDVVFVLLVK